MFSNFIYFDVKIRTSPVVVLNIPESIIKNPRKIFIVDGVGALLSSFLLGVVLVEFEQEFGIPPSALYVLAALPILFALFDFLSYRFSKKPATNFRLIAAMNLLYCGFSVGMALFHKSSITYLGWGYILGEIIIVSILALFELSLAKRIE